MASEETDLASSLIEIKVFSQLPETNGSIQMPAISAGSTVRELKEHIQSLVTSRPSVESQRLIYRGRVLARDTDTLIQVFGQGAIQRRENQTLHLVIRDQQHPPPPASATASQNAHPRSTPTTPAIPGPHQAARPHVPGAGPLPGIHLQHHLPPGQAPIHSNPLNVYQHQPSAQQQVPGNFRSNSPAVLPQSPFQPLQPARGVPSQHQALHQQLHQQALQQHMMPPPLDGYANSLFPPGFPQNMQLPIPAAHQAALQNQIPYAPTNSTQNAMPTLGSQQNGNQITNADTNPSTSAPLLQHRSASGSSGVRQDENTGSTADENTNSTTQFQNTPQSTQVAPPVAMQRGNILPNFASPQPLPIQPSNFPPLAQPQLQTMAPSRWHPQYQGYLGPLHAIEYMQALQHRLEMSLQLIRWCYPPEDDPTRPAVVTHGLVFLRDLVIQRNGAQAAINVVLRNGPQGGYSAPSPQQISELQSLNFRFRSVAREWMSDIERVRQARNGTNTTADLETSRRETQTATSGVTQPLQPTATTPSPDSSTIAYILSNSAGPSAIVYIGPDTYTSLPHPTNPLSRSSIGNQQNNSSNRNRSPNTQNPVDPRAVTNGGAATNTLNQINRANNEGIRQLQQLQPRDQGPQRAIAINVVPILQAIWLFIRVYVFIWVFLGGRGLGDRFLSWQTLFLFGMTVGYCALRLGIGGERLEAMRRYWNDLVGIEPPAQDNRPAQQRAGNGQRADVAALDGGRAAGAGQDSRQPNVQEQHGARNANGEVRRNEGSLRELFRPVERTVALFLGSLYPGVGERHIAERERMRREAEDRDRARAATAAQEEPQQLEESGAHLSSPATTTNTELEREAPDQPNPSAEEHNGNTPMGVAKKETGSVDDTDAQASSSSVDAAQQNEGFRQRRADVNEQ